MGRNKKKNQSNRRKTGKKQKCIMIALAVVLIVLLIWAAIVYRESSKEKRAEKTKEEQQITFPYELEDGKLQIDSLFQFTGTNPDCEDQDGENIAALTVVNQSEQQLKFAQITISLTNGTELNFEVTDIPSGDSDTVFEKNNNSFELSDQCDSISCSAEFEKESVLMEDKVSVSVQETTVALTNISNEDLTNLVLHCHCKVDDAYFGGLTYTYPVENILAGESVTLQAEECYLGEAAVVRISRNNTADE